ncbi:putative PurR-regulated permease PerM [Kribbella amoyensis]|uniref:Putative PurR-regulated permease PerM n=1 Tax=Kribbella amoyensis TaxID=996641 RepID=A0A561BMJ6_9ACTN|nr:AI-2E family transporter [Kribbella amoyensis]TWD80069.1 putative PurR-regulated permease PerM [Kribbella amoyensis]
MAPTLDDRPIVPRGLVVLGTFAAAVVVIAGLRSAAGLVGPVFLALVLTIVVHPVRGWLRRLKLPNWAASLICVITVYGLLLGLAVALVIATARFATLLPSYATEFDDLVDDVAAKLAELGIGQDQITQVLGTADFGRIAGVIQALLGSVVDAVSSLVFILALLLFLTMDAGTFPALLSRAEASRSSLVAALLSFAHGTRRYLVVSTVFGFIVAVIDTVALAILGIPVPVLWGLLAFITNYIPNIGFVIGVIPPAVLGLLEGGWSLALTVVVVYSVINFIIQSVIQPKIVGDAVGLSTTLTFLSLVFWSWVIGGLGALLAIPLSLLVRALLVDVDPQSAWLTPLLSNRDNGDTTPPEVEAGEPETEEAETADQDGKTPGEGGSLSGARSPHDAP